MIKAPLALLLSLQFFLTAAQTNYNCGFTCLAVKDFSRPYSIDTFTGNITPRQINIHLWYPTTQKANEDFLFRNYLRFNHVSDSGWHSIPEQEPDEAGKEVLSAYQLPDDSIKLLLPMLLNTHTQVIYRAMYDTMRFPLVIIFSGLNVGAYTHTLFAEHLAGNGYVVMQVPSLGLRKGEKTPFDMEGITMQADDISYALNQLQDRAFVDLNRIALVSWSAGGVSAALFLQKNPAVRAFLSLDGGTGYQYGLDMLHMVPQFRWNRTGIPTLHMHGDIAQIPVPKNFGYLDSARKFTGAVYRLKSMHLDHFHFTSVANIMNRISGRVNNFSYGYARVEDVSVAFLNAFVKKQPQRFDAMIDSFKTGGNDAFVLEN